MLKAIKKYLSRAKEEMEKGYSVSSEETAVIAGERKQVPKLWTGLDLDGTLAYLDRNSAYDTVGEPVPAMMAMLRQMLDAGIRVKIFTARASDPDQYPIIRRWLRENNLPELEITNVKDYNMVRLYDDRCIQVERNTGRLIVDKLSVNDNMKGMRQV